MINLKDKKVIITGGTGGIGYSLVEKFVHAGANVLATGTNLEKIENLNKNFKNIKTLQFDISKHDEIETFVDNASSVLGGGIDILINNAGIIDVNLTSTFLISKNVIKKMLKNKSGKIINITSVVGHTGNIGQSNYTASKAAIVGMSKSLAIEFAKKNININCISPGFITTAMTDQIEEKFKEALKNKIPADRFGSPSDVANTAIFLASELADYITGETIHVNGGMYLG